MSRYTSASPPPLTNGIQKAAYAEAELPDIGEGEAIDTSIPADPNVRNYSYTVVDGDVYYRENSRMVKPDLNATAIGRVKGMVELRDCVQKLIGQQLDGFVSDVAIHRTQAELNDLYDACFKSCGPFLFRPFRLPVAERKSENETMGTLCRKVSVASVTGRTTTSSIMED